MFSAQRHIKENNFGIAFGIYESILKLDPSNCEQNKALLYEMAQISYDLSWNLATAHKFICRYVQVDPKCPKAKDLKEAIDLKLKEKISCFKKQNEANEELQKNWGRFDKSYQSVVKTTNHDKIAATAYGLKKPIHIDSAAIPSVKHVEVTPRVYEKPTSSQIPVVEEKENARKIPERINNHTVTTNSNSCVGQKPNNASVDNKNDILYKTEINLKTKVDKKIKEHPEKVVKTPEPFNTYTEPTNSKYSAGQNLNSTKVENKNDEYKTEINLKTKTDEKTKKQSENVKNLNHTTKYSSYATVDKTTTYAEVARTSSDKKYRDTENTFIQNCSRAQEANVNSRNNYRSMKTPQMNKENASGSKNHKDDKNPAKPQKKSFWKFW